MILFLQISRKASDTSASNATSQLPLHRLATKELLYLRGVKPSARPDARGSGVRQFVCDPEMVAAVIGGVLCRAYCRFDQATPNDFNYKSLIRKRRTTEL